MYFLLPVSDEDKHQVPNVGICLQAYICLNHLENNQDFDQYMDYFRLELWHNVWQIEFIL